MRLIETLLSEVKELMYDASRNIRADDEFAAGYGQGYLAALEEVHEILAEWQDEEDEEW